MYCPNCGARNSEEATNCSNCGQELRRIETPGPEEPVPPPPPPGPGGQAQTTSYGPQSDVPNYLVQAILTTIFCCFPLGIVSIVYAAQVNGKLAAGDRAGALESSRNARRWAWISFGSALVLGVVLFGGYIILILIGALAGS